jgi:hypothetical protein
MSSGPLAQQFESLQPNLERAPRTANKDPSCSCEVNLLSDVGGVENESPEMKAVRRQQSFKLAMAGVTNAKEAANFRWARMENMNACYHSRRLQIAIQYTFPFQYRQL